MGYQTKEYCNYHKHDHISSIFTPDTHIKCEEYIKRAIELGHTTYFTTNHGSGGDIFESKKLCDEYGIRCIFGVEGYIVPNPLEKDNRNYHVIIIPRTDEARKKINLITSRANIEGYYYKPRIFVEDLLNLDKNDVYITTACVAGIIRDEDSFNNIFLPLVHHFKTSVFLEVQSHDVPIQKELNRKCVKLAKKYGLKLIAANDSHYVYPEQARDRDEYLKGKGINYSDENSFILDYPDYETMVNRFKKQGVLSDIEIIEAIENTKVFIDCEDIKLDREIKMPSVYPAYTPEEKIAELKNHINIKFKKICKDEHITGELKKTYIQGIREEMQVIEATSTINTADYFLFNEQNTELAVNKYNGVLTRTGRGSCGSFYINRILSMTQIDRFVSPIKLYPERFMSTARLLENRALPDIDFNVVAQEPFVKASRKLLGEQGCYPMIAYGTMKDGEAFRNVCRSHGLDFNEYNEVAKDFSKYENNAKWKPLIEESKKYIGAIVSASVHPCAFVLDNKDLRKEYGVVKIGDAICVMVTSGEADYYKLLKNDYLIVSCWKLIAETFEMINKPIMPIVELLSNINDKVWDLYSDGLTCTLNQCDGDWATSMLKNYKPKTLAELSMFVAAIRPSFNSWRNIYINRMEYTTGCPQLDEVLKSTNGFILFQENLMQYFEWLGVTPAESIGLIKKISKKKIKQADFDNLEEKLRENWIKQTGSIEIFSETWKMIQSCISYGFCSSHAECVAIDSLYGAYLKANYPLEYFTVCLNNYVSDEEKTHKLTSELSSFNISVLPVKFRHSKDTYTPDKANSAIYKGIASVKFLNATVAQKLYEMRDVKFNSFVEFLDVNPCNSKQTKILISLDFFSEFGKSGRLMSIYDLHTKYAKKKTIKKENCDLPKSVVKKYCFETEKMYKVNDICGLIEELCSEIPDEDLPVSEIIKSQMEFLGYIDYTNPRFDKSYVYVSGLDTKNSPRFQAYCINNGKSLTMKIHKTKNYKQPEIKQSFKQTPISNGDIICMKSCKREPKRIKVGDEWQADYTNMEWWINDYYVVN